MLSCCINVFSIPSPLSSSSEPSAAGVCADGMLQCARGGCVDQRQVCDGTDDCGDSTDEQNCGEGLAP